MRVPVTLAPAAALLLAVGLAGDATAGASHAGCTAFVDAVPFQATVPGTYCLRADLVLPTESTAVHAGADDVVIDCNGFSIRQAAPYVGTGVVVVGHRAVVRNCDLRGFHTGIYVYGTDTVVEHNTMRDLGGPGIYSQGARSRVVHNRILDVGLTSVGSATGLVAYGIADVSHNTVDGVRPLPDATYDDAAATGIYLYIGAGQVTGNRIRNLVSIGDGIERGIDAWGGEVQIARNHIDGREDRPDSWAIHCSGGSSPRVGDNVVTGFYRMLASGAGIAARSPGCLSLGPDTLVR